MDTQNQSTPACTKPHKKRAQSSTDKKGPLYSLWEDALLLNIMEKNNTRPITEIAWLAIKKNNLERSEASIIRRVKTCLKVLTDEQKKTLIKDAEVRNLFKKNAPEKHASFKKSKDSKNKVYHVEDQPAWSNKIINSKSSKKVKHQVIAENNNSQIKTSTDLIFDLGKRERLNDLSSDPNSQRLETPDFEAANCISPERVEVVRSQFSPGPLKHALSSSAKENEAVVDDMLNIGSLLSIPAPFQAGATVNLMRQTPKKKEKKLSSLPLQLKKEIPKLVLPTDAAAAVVENQSSPRNEQQKEIEVKAGVENPAKPVVAEPTLLIPTPIPTLEMPQEPIIQKSKLVPLPSKTVLSKMLIKLGGVSSLSKKSLLEVARSMKEEADQILMAREEILKFAKDL